MVKHLVYNIVSITFVLLTTFSIYVEGLSLCSFIPKKNRSTHIRLALRPTGVTVSWTTDGFADIDDTPSPQIVYGTDQNALTMTSTTGFTTSYYIIKKFFHNVYLDNLQPSTKYYYRIKASSNFVDESNIYSFMTAPTPGITTEYPVNLSFVGDLSLDNDFNQNQPYEDTWNTFQDNLQPISANVPYQVGPGNHEATCFQYSDAICPSFLRNFTAYQNRFCMSGDLSGGYKNMWYSFDYGPIHVIMLNTETDFVDAPTGPDTTLNAGHFVGKSAQVTWLQADLQKATDPAQRAKVPWIVATGHRPFYGSTVVPAVQIVGHAIIPPSDNCRSCELAFMPLLSQYKVDFYFAGHLHWMELLYPLDASGNIVTRNFTSGDGLIHVTDGAGAAPTSTEKIKTNDTERQAWICNGYGFHQLLIQDSSHAILNFIDSSTTTVIKSVDIVRKR
ncbi:hypothetical protein I4U23_003560 [Adineta vaga]|nr:hypothetical protein I4U23_003560 [Adineta vaga]